MKNKKNIIILEHFEFTLTIKNFQKKTTAKMYDYSLLKAAASTRAAKVYSYLSRRLNSPISVSPLRLEGICFRANFSKANGHIRGVSISTCKILEDNEPDTRELEIALVGKEGKLIYDDSMGYDDVCTFEDEDKALEEIIRIHEIATQ